jgi:hypothetical protein
MASATRVIHATGYKPAWVNNSLTAGGKIGATRSRTRGLAVSPAGYINPAHDLRE